MHYVVEDDSGNTDFDSIGVHNDASIILLLQAIPFVLPFEKRVELFYRFIEQDLQAQTPSWKQPINVRRDFILEDGFTRLKNYSGLDFKQQLRVQFQSKDGHMEEGVGQGVFKEFLVEFVVIHHY